ncbi:MAG: hypothetical protein PUH24_08785 [Prevotellaceae bacterium]|nr:hypothetical protein [Prevotella sp.]MDD7258342.1 hypothetical protein [Prevotellaceae bacterium]MDY6129900.1 hypothetical protein [Prevotella sp.]
MNFIYGMWMKAGQMKWGKAVLRPAVCRVSSKSHLPSFERGVAGSKESSGKLLHEHSVFIPVVFLL